ncbi:hypothetical protein KFE80_05510 [bacterium SCSIO 12696]|nr:hypothetical protein KFE80_05510 [bacterium SCSIO 12696]
MIFSKIVVSYLAIVSFSISAEDVEENFIDLNGDGVSDISYEYTKSGYYELMDRNFDGKVDQSSFYDLNHYLKSARSDDDFDGILETKTVYEDSLIQLVLTDSDNNQLYDIVLEYQDNLVISGRRYYKKMPKRPNPFIGKTKFRFGYPVGQEDVRKTKMSEKDFHDSVAKNFDN